MAQPPDTIIKASPSEAEYIRAAIRNVATVETPYGAYRPVTLADAVQHPVQSPDGSRPPD